MTDPILTKLENSQLYIKMAIECLDDTHLLDNSKLDDAYTELTTIRASLCTVREEYENADKKDWDTTIGDK